MKSDEPTIHTDSDGDGVIDFDEIERFGTNPYSNNSDGDGLLDKIDIQSYVFGNSPIVQKYEGYESDINEGPDTDGDTFRAEVDPDSDNDGLLDGSEDLNANGFIDFRTDETDPFASSGSTVYWNEDINLHGDVYVQPGLTLDISGVTINCHPQTLPETGYFSEGVELIVEGRLIANGTTFKSGKEPEEADAGDWWGIYIDGGSYSQLNNCTIRHATWALRCYSTDYLEITGCNISDTEYLTIKIYYSYYVKVLNNTVYGGKYGDYSCIYGDYLYYPLIEGNTLFSSTHSGIHISYGSGTILRNNTINYCEKGICIDSASVSIDGGSIHYNDYGIYLIDDVNECEVQNTLIENNIVAGIDMSEGYLTIQNCDINDNSKVGILYRLNSQGTITNTVIANNGDGSYHTGGVVIEDSAQPNLGNLENPSTDDDGGNTFSDNSFYDIANYTSNDIYAQGNDWNTSDSYEIATRIYDHDDDANLGEIIYFPYQTDNTSIPVHVPLQDYESTCAPLVFKILQNGEVLRTIPTTVPYPKGQTVLDTNLSAGTYDICAKSYKFLAKAVTDVDVYDGMSTVEFSELLGADSDNNNFIDLSDFGTMAAFLFQDNLEACDFLPQPEAPPSVWHADFDGSGYVDDVIDFDILVANFFQIGDDCASASQAPSGLPQQNLPIAVGNFEIQFLTPKDAIKAGEEFQIQIFASGVNDIKGYVFDIEYNLSQLDVLEDSQAVVYQHLAQEAGFLKESGNETLFFAKARDYSDKQGRVTVAGFITGKGMGVSGDGSLAQMRFRLKEQPASITLNNIIVADHEGTMRMLPVKSFPLELIPQQAGLGNNFPNPFNPDTWIPYQLSESAHVVIKIYNIQGQLVRTLDLGRKDAGYYTTKERAGYWDGRNVQGERVASGVYFYTIKAGNFFATKKLTIVK